MLIDVPYHPESRFVKVLTVLVLAILYIPLVTFLGVLTFQVHAVAGYAAVVVLLVAPVLLYFLLRRRRDHRYLRETWDTFEGEGVEAYARHLLDPKNEQAGNMVKVAAENAFGYATQLEAWGTTLRIGPIGTLNEVVPREHSFEPTNVREPPTARSLIFQVVNFLWLALLVVHKIRSSGKIFNVYTIGFGILFLFVGGCHAYARWAAYRVRHRPAEEPQPAHIGKPVQAGRPGLVEGDWCVVPSGLVVREPMGTQAHVELFTREECIAFLLRLPGRPPQWSAELLRRDGSWTYTTFTPKEADRFLSGWLSSVSPPDPDRLTDLE
jgi:hypothetical protein